MVILADRGNGARRPGPGKGEEVTPSSFTIDFKGYTLEVFYGDQLIDVDLWLGDVRVDDFGSIDDAITWVLQAEGRKAA
jgi:hypothetical protein